MSKVFARQARRSEIEPKNLRKKSRTWWRTLVVPVLERQRHADSLGLASQPSLIGELQANGQPYLKTQRGAVKMAHWDKALAARPDVLRFIPGTHTVEGEKSFLEAVFWRLHTCHGMMHVHISNKWNVRRKKNKVNCSCGMTPRVVLWPLHACEQVQMNTHIHVCTNSPNRHCTSPIM